MLHSALLRSCMFYSSISNTHSATEVTTSIPPGPTSNDSKLTTHPPQHAIPSKPLLSFIRYLTLSLIPRRPHLLRAFAVLSCRLRSSSASFPLAIAPSITPSSSAAESAMAAVASPAPSPAICTPPTTDFLAQVALMGVNVPRLAAAPTDSRAVAGAVCLATGGMDLARLRSRKFQTFSFVRRVSLHALENKVKRRRGREQVKNVSRGTERVVEHGRWHG